MGYRVVAMRRLLCGFLIAIGLTLPAVQGAAATTPSFSAAMRSAATARQVPLPLVEAVAYVNTRWEPMNTPAFNHGVGPMNIRPAQMAEATLLSGHSETEITNDPAANLDAGAALLAHAHGAGSDLASWRSAVEAVLGVYVAVEVFDALRSGASRTTSTGEQIALAPQTLPPSPQAATATISSSDYPGATWIPASSANFSIANRPRDYPIDMIVIHDIEGTYGSAVQEFQNPAVQASAHYVVGSNGQIAQMVLERDIAWHAGNWDYNTRSIGIEHEGYVCCNYYTDPEYRASAQLIASICSRWGVPMDRTHVIGHYQVPDPYNPGQFGGAGHHTDPGPYWNWSLYMGYAVADTLGLPSPPHMVLDATALGGDGTAQVSWQAARSCRVAVAGYTVVAQPGNIVVNVPASATTATLSGLQNGTTYTFTVTAHNADGQDQLSSNPVTPGPLTITSRESLGGPIGSAPAIASWDSNRLDTFYAGTDMQLLHRWSVGSGWSAPEPLGGVLTSGPAAVSWGPNRVDVFVRGTDNALWHKFWVGGWSNWESLGGVLTSAPAVASWSSDRIDVLVRGTDQQMWHKDWNGTNWSNWDPLGGVLTSAAAVTSRASDRLDVFVRGTDQQTWHKWWDGLHWQGWELLPGVLASAPAAASWAPDQVSVLALTGTGTLQLKTWNGTGWTAWRDVGGGTLQGDPAAVSRTYGIVDVVGQGTDSALWHAVLKGSF